MPDIVSSFDKKLATKEAYRWLEEHRSSIERTRTQLYWIQIASKAGCTWARKRYQTKRRPLGDIRYIQSAAVEAYLDLPAREEAAFRAWLTGAFAIITLLRQDP